jgi:hypothetical protein
MPCFMLGYGPTVLAAIGVQLVERWLSKAVVAHHWQALSKEVQNIMHAIDTLVLCIVRCLLPHC